MIEVLNSGIYTTVQDYPGRVGYWNVGIPPSGPMDPLAFRIANYLVGNDDEDAGIEITITGPRLKFLTDAIIAITGAELEADLDGKPVVWWKAFTVIKGSILTIDKLKGNGCRSYLAVQGGINVPGYLGSRSTFPKGGFGGHEGRPLKKGDFIKLFRELPDIRHIRNFESSNLPCYSNNWKIGVITGPYAAPDYFTQADMDLFLETEWQVHYNSNRMGYRLQGPKMEFARKDGGEGGRHPSNVNDYAYAVGTINTTGDMPIVIGVDGPSLGGFTSIATIASSQFWKIGQAKPGDTIQFKQISITQSIKDTAEQNKFLAG